jgi:hypothetical protein
MAAYGQSHRENWVWLAMVLGGLFAGIALTVWLSRFTQSPWLFVGMVLPFLVGIILAVRRMKAMKRARKDGIRATLESQGYAVDLAPSSERAQTVFAPVAHLQQPLALRDGAAKIDWLALHGPSTLLFEHSYVTGSGKSTVEHNCTVFVVSAAHANLPRARMGSEPWVFSEHARFLNRRLLRSSGTAIAIDDGTFDAAWVTFGSAATAQAFFTDRVRDILAESPKGEVWCVGAGFVCCAYRGALAAPHLSRMIERANEVLGPG